MLSCISNDEYFSTTYAYIFMVKVIPHEIKFKQDLLQLLGINMKFSLEGRASNTVNSLLIITNNNYLRKCCQNSI